MYDTHPVANMSCNAYVVFFILVEACSGVERKWTEPLPESEPDGWGVVFICF